MVSCKKYRTSANSFGLGNCIYGYVRIVFETEKGQSFKEKMIPDGYEFGAGVLVVYSVDDSGMPHESDISKISYIG